MMAEGPRDLPPVKDAKFADRTREEVQRLLGFRGDPLDKALTGRSLGWTGAQLSGVGSGGAIPTATDPDLTPPPNVAVFTASAGITNVFVEVGAPLYAQGHGHKQTNIYGVQKVPGDPSLPVFADAVKVYEATGPLTFMAIPSEPNVRWHLWAKYESVDGVESVSPAGGTNGLVAQTGQDVSHLLDVLSAAALDPLSTYTQFAVRADQFYIASADAVIGDIVPFIVQTSDTVVNGVTIPKGVYMDAAFIVNLTAGIARLGNAWIDNAMIGSLSASKLTVGDGTVGGNLKSTVYSSGASGWLLQPSGAAEFNNVTVRGAVYASSGSFSGAITATSGFIGGAVIGSNYVESSNYNGTGLGWRLDNGLGKGFFGKLLVSNTGATRIFDTEATGSSPVLKIGTAVEILASGAATFGGSLTAPNIVTTDNLQLNSATAPSIATTSAAISVGSTETTVQSVAVTTVGGTVEIDFGCVWKSEAVYDPGSGDIEKVMAAFRIYRDATLLFDSGAVLPSTHYAGSAFTADYNVLRLPPLFDTPSAGSHTYYAKIVCSSSTGISAKYRNLALVEYRR